MQHQGPDLPASLKPDALAWYIYRHYSNLLTEEERLASRVLDARSREFARGTPNSDEYLRVVGVLHARQNSPGLMTRIDQVGVAAVMRAAADRVLRDHPQEVVLNCCARCGQLCLTPRAKQCFSCGFDWH